MALKKIKQADVVNDRKGCSDRASGPPSLIKQNLS